MPKTSARLLALLSLLQTRRDWPGTLLADRLDVSLRTVRRDVDRLRDLGYPIAAAKGPDGGYRLSAGTELPPLLFDDEQAVALTIALQIAATTPDSGQAESAARALTTIRQVLPARLRSRVTAVQVTAVERPTTQPSAAVGSDVLLTISAAIRARESLRFDYTPQSGTAQQQRTAHQRETAEPKGTDQGGTTQRRRAEPHQIVTRDGRWYLVAWDLDRDDWRTFRIDRLTLRTPNGPRFASYRELPDVAGHFQGATCRGTVLLDLPAAEVAPYVHDGAVEAVGPDRCRLTLSSWSWTGLAAAIARFDADFEVAGPPELTEAFARLAARFTRAATEGASHGSTGAAAGPRARLALG
jgi:predicted DNA-binding transcriptional regulator YafY